jgi:hypothetical protein
MDETHIIDFSRAITRALNVGMLRDAQFLIDTETYLMFDESEEPKMEEFYSNKRRL